MLQIYLKVTYFLHFLCITQKVHWRISSCINNNWFKLWNACLNSGVEKKQITSFRKFSLAVCVYEKQLNKSRKKNKNQQHKKIKAGEKSHLIWALQAVAVTRDVQMRLNASHLLVLNANNATGGAQPACVCACVRRGVCVWPGGSLTSESIAEWEKADRWRWWTNRAVTSKGRGREH